MPFLPLLLSMILYVMELPVQAHPGHGPIQFRSIRSGSNHSIDHHTDSDKYRPSAAIVVERTIRLDLQACERAYDPILKECLVYLDTSELVHFDNGATSRSVNLSAQRRVGFDTYRFAGYRARWVGPQGVAVEEQLKDIAVAIERLGGSFAPPVVLYRNARNQREASALPGAISDFGLYQDKMLGRALGVQREMEIKESDCLQRLNDRTCFVDFLPADHPDHPGPKLANIPVCHEHHFDDGGQVKMCLDGMYDRYFVSYYPAEGIPDSDEAKRRISTAIQKLRGTNPKLVFEAWMLTPDNPDLPSRQDPRLVDHVIGHALFELSHSLVLRLDLCLNAFDLTTSSCEVPIEDLTYHPSPNSVINHPGGDERKIVDFGSEGFVRFDWSRFRYAYQVSFVPGEEAHQGSKEYVSDAFSQLGLVPQLHKYEIRVKQ